MTIVARSVAISSSIVEIKRFHCLFGMMKAEMIIVLVFNDCLSVCGCWLGGEEPVDGCWASSDRLANLTMKGCAASVQSFLLLLVNWLIAGRNWECFFCRGRSRLLKRIAAARVVGQVSEEPHAPVPRESFQSATRCPLSSTFN